MASTACEPVIHYTVEARPGDLQGPALETNGLIQLTAVAHCHLCVGILYTVLLHRA